MPHIETIKRMSWQDTYGHECRIFKHELSELSRTLRYDPKQLGFDRIDIVCKRLMALSFQIQRVLEAANGMFGENADSNYVRRAPPGWFVGRVEDAEIEIQCSILEYNLCKKAEQLREDHSMDLMIAAYLETMMEDFEKDFGV
ncbi:hypothetical protein N7467_008407 [Penicillium canescens]|nr:hypothetical protein N7467_008407 [Penicillium canescens]